MAKQHKGHHEFYKIVDELKELHSAKSCNYADNEDPFRNLKLCESANIPMWAGVIIRLGDKYSRQLNELRKAAEVGFDPSKVYTDRDEFVDTLEDALKDMATYAILALISYRDEKRKRE